MTEIAISRPRPIQIARPRDTQEWLDLRRPWFNASAAAALFGDHPFQSLASIVRAKLEPVDGDGLGTAATRRGQHLEPAIAGWWSDEHGVALYEPEVMYARGPILATLDRRIVGNDTDAVEIKTTAKHVSRPERYWWWQVQAQCHAAALERVHVVVLDASMSLATYVVTRDDDAIERLVARAESVMAYVARGEWPPDLPLEETPRHSDRVVELDPVTVADVDSWLTARAEIRRLEAVEADHKARILTALGDAQAATVDGRVVLTYRTHTRSNINLARLRAEHADLVAELSTDSVVRVLRAIDSGITRPDNTDRRQ